MQHLKSINKVWVILRTPRTVVSNSRNMGLGCRAHGETILWKDYLQKAEGSSKANKSLSNLLTLLVPLSSLGKQDIAATIVKRQILMMKTNQVMHYSFSGARKVLSQKKWDVKTSTRETTDYMLKETDVLSVGTTEKGQWTQSRIMEAPAKHKDNIRATCCGWPCNPYHSVSASSSYFILLLEKGLFCLFPMQK